MKELVILAGLPGTGKTTAAEGYIEQNIDNYSTPIIISMPISDSVSELELNYGTFHEQVSYHINNSADLIIADAPNECPDRYKELVKLAKQHSYAVKLVNFMDADIKALGVDLQLVSNPVSGLKVVNYLRKLGRRSSKKPSLSLMAYLAKRWNCENISL